MPLRSARSGSLYSAGLLQSPLYTRTTQDALNVLECLARADAAETDSSRQIPALAQETGLDVPTVTQIVGFLRQAGLISDQSPAGGVTLARQAQEISLLDIVRSTEGSGLLGRCVMGLAQCSDEAPCPLHTIWKNTREAFEQHLANQSLADLTETLLRRRRIQPGRARTGS